MRSEQIFRFDQDCWYLRRFFDG